MIEMSYEAALAAAVAVRKMLREVTAPEDQDSPRQRNLREALQALEQLDPERATN